MNLLLDTHVLVWWMANAPQLSRRVKDLVGTSENRVHVSAASAWEIATKVRIGKMAFDTAFLDDFDASVKALAFIPLMISSRHAVAGARLIAGYKDPFDRLLAGQALVEQLTVATADPAFAAFGVPTVW